MCRDHVTDGVNGGHLEALVALAIAMDEQSHVVLSDILKVFRISRRNLREGERSDKTNLVEETA